MINAIKALRKEMRLNNIKSYYGTKIVKTPYGMFRVNIHRDTHGVYDISAVGISGYVVQKTPEIPQSLFTNNEKLHSVINKTIKSLNSYTFSHCEGERAITEKWRKINKYHSHLKYLFDENASQPKSKKEALSAETEQRLL